MLQRERNDFIDERRDVAPMDVHEVSQWAVVISVCKLGKCAAEDRCGVFQRLFISRDTQSRGVDMAKHLELRGWHASGIRMRCRVEYVSDGSRCEG